VSSSQRPVAFITGASTGIGRATANRLAADGYDLALADVSTDMLAETCSDEAVRKVKVEKIAFDLRNHAQIKAAVAQALKAFGRIDALVNNAGRQLRTPAIDVTWEDYDDVMNINLKGAYFLTIEVARHWLANKLPGSVVNISSTHAVTGLPMGHIYGMSKSGIAGMTRMLAIEWATDNIRVNAVAPATVLTPSRQKMLADPARREHMQNRLPQKRFPTADDIADGIAYLVNPRARAVTGHLLPVDAGLLAV
jgi:NAD(P)-dependent dehydrogenase (short-subunit alcohol dehydrogenase family)